jgi:aminoglycoside/choline kinase family phosphotransferase
VSGDYGYAVRTAARALGITAVTVEPIAGDASRRSFYRVGGPLGTVIAAVYPTGAEAQVQRDETVHAWGWQRGLPIPRPLGHTDLVAFAEDLGDDDLAHALRRQGADVLGLALEALGVFQETPWSDLVTPAFSAAFFRSEIAVFEQYALPSPTLAADGVGRFLDDLCARLEQHPFRLVHRDFHVNNLFLRGGSVVAVDYQDMRGGPDTYDVVSLLRERSAAELVGDDKAWRERAAHRLSWEAGWEKRYLECAAQRGLKVVGTFLRLVSWGRSEYQSFLPGVKRRARQAVADLGGPGALLDVLE